MPPDAQYISSPQCKKAGIKNNFRIEITEPVWLKRASCIVFESKKTDQSDFVPIIKIPKWLPSRMALRSFGWANILANMARLVYSPLSMPVPFIENWNWQARLEQNEVISNYELHRFTQMPFGLQNSPSTIQRATNMIRSAVRSSSRSSPWLRSKFFRSRFPIISAISIWSFVINLRQRCERK